MVRPLPIRTLLSGRCAAPISPALCQRFAWLLSIITIAWSLAVLLGWGGGLAFLTRLQSNQVAMNPMTAICFLVLGIALSPPLRRRVPGRLGWPSLLGGCTVAAIGAAQLVSYGLELDLPLDRWLFAGRLGDNRMAPNTGACFVGAGLALLTLDHHVPWIRCWAAECFAILTAAVSMVSLVGYSYGAESLYRLSPWIPMALNTAILFQLTSVAILFSRPDRGAIQVILSPALGGMMARRLLPFAVIVPGLLGWLRLLGQRYGWYELEIGVAFSVATTIIMFSIVIVWAAWIMNRVDEERQLAAESLRRSSDEIFDLYNHAPCGYHSVNDEGLIIAMNDTELRWLGYLRDEIVGRRSFHELLTSSSQQQFATSFEQFKRKGSVSDLDFTLVRKDGSQLPVVLSATAIFDGQGRYLASRSTVFDATDLKRAELEVRRLNETLESRVRQRTEQLARAYSELAQKNQENEVFVYSVSHDLRSPLVNLQGFSQELELTIRALREVFEDPKLPEEYRRRGLPILDNEVKQSVEFIQSAVIRVDSIIHALLRLSRVGRVEYQHTAVDLNKTIARILQASHNSILTSEATFVVEELPSAWGDSTALEQVFANLIDNALKYRDPQRPLVIQIGSLSAGGDGKLRGMHTYFIGDNGIGIADNQREKIFQAFRRLDPDRAPGEGMGLSIVRRILERHGGRIWVESNEGEGTTFLFTLPVAQSNLPIDDSLEDSHTKTETKHDCPAVGDPVGRR